MNEQFNGITRLWFVGLTAASLSIAGCTSETTPVAATELPLPMMSAPTPFIRPGAQQPPVDPAGGADIDAEEPVIGVTVGDVHRAYVCTGMHAFDAKVINDMIDGVPVTVTYCNRTGCSRAFTAKGWDRPLKVDLGGWSGKKMVLRIDGQMLEQDSAEIPFQEIAVERMTWGAWKTAHPDTEVFTGLAGTQVRESSGE